MFKNYLKIALRNVRRNKLISFINIFGLGLSMSIGMLILIRMTDQFSYDNFHNHPERIYRVITDYTQKTGEHWKMASTPFPLAEALKNKNNAIKSIVNIYPGFSGKAIAEGKELQLDGAFTGPAFFDVLGFKLSSGDPKTALSHPNSIILSRTSAKKYFGNSNAIGKVFDFKNGEQYIVTGILQDPPSKSHITYDVFVSLTSIAGLEKNKKILERSQDFYAFNTAYTYVRLKDNKYRKLVTGDLDFISNDLNSGNKNGKVKFELQPLGKITPGSTYLHNEIGDGGSWAKMYFEIGVAMLILLAACFNYTNLTIARALSRAKEVGIRKVAGARRIQIFAQYILEAVLLSLLALLFAGVLLHLILQWAPFNDDYEFIPATYQPDWYFYLYCIAFMLCTGLLAGAGPAWILSSFQPIRVLKNLVTVKIFGKISLQKTLIVFQYSLSLTIIIFLLSFYQQFAFLSGSEPGFNRENVLVVPLGENNEQVTINKFESINGVQSVSAMSSVFKKRFAGLTVPASTVSQGDKIALNYYYTDPDFVKNLGLHMAAGTDFSALSRNDAERYILINAQAAIAFGYKNITEAIGKNLVLDDSVSLEIVGVIQNFNYEAVGRPILPLALRTKTGSYRYLYVRTSKTGNDAVEASARQIAKSHSGQENSELTWLDEALQENNSQSATISLLGYLAFMAFAIATLGLLGLVVYTVETKRKEISIRKIIGATEKQLVAKLSSGFVKLIIIAGLVAVPLGYTAAILFLQGFSQRIKFGITEPILCFTLLLAVGLLTIVSQTWKAALANPAKDLRME